jgi:hypothetical protein
MDELELQAAHLNSINTVEPDAKPAYDAWSGAIVWSDETNSETTTETIWALRQLFAYRTHLMQNKTGIDNDVWRYCQSLFPAWIGFLPQRCEYTSEIAAEYRRGSVSARWCLRQMERESNGAG